MRAVITVVGKDTVGILAKVSAICAEHQVNIVEVTQSILQDMFCMIMLVDISACASEPAEIRARFDGGPDPVQHFPLRPIRRLGELWQRKQSFYPCDA